MPDLVDIHENMTIVGSDGRHVGTVDAVVGQLLKLKANDPEAGGVHHFLPWGLVGWVEDEKAILMVPAVEAKQRWSDEIE